MLAIRPARPSSCSEALEVKVEKNSRGPGGAGNAAEGIEATCMQYSPVKAGIVRRWAEGSLNIELGLQLIVLQGKVRSLGIVTGSE